MIVISSSFAPSAMCTPEGTGSGRGFFFEIVDVVGERGDSAAVAPRDARASAAQGVGADATARSAAKRTAAARVVVRIVVRPRAAANTVSSR